MPIKVAIVEDDTRIREGLAVLLNGSDEFSCVGSYPNAEVALKQMPQQWPDVVLMDINLPNMSGIECVAGLKELRPALQIIMLTICADDEEIFDSLRKGASGYLIKKTPPAKILEAIVDVHCGGAPMSSAIARRVVQYMRQEPASPGKPENLSKREYEILGYLAKGYQYKEIADVLSISLLTVSTHIKNIYEKLHVHSRTEAVVKFLESGKRQAP
jgi:DNA-binding NarL/FixJ family response regulator